MTCPDEIKRLIDRFDQQADQVRSPDYNETQLRVDFINPMFRALGWDVDNRQGYAEQYREVVHEDRVKVAGQTKAPDYSFRVGGQRKFFLEAKKPAVDILQNVEPAYQLRRYAWSAKLSCSLLSNFEQFAIYDARIRPKHLEKASTARREFFRYREYPERWDFLYDTFSKEAVLKGEFDRYCQSQKGRGAQEFDDAFLGEIEQWRQTLANSLAKNNPALDEAGLNFSVQRIIDRIIFLRIAEDRGTETVGQLQGLLNGPNIYERLASLFRRADERYNSGLFHFEAEKGRDENPDTLTPGLHVDDKTLKDIVRALYYPQSPYEFTMVSADILGSIYERFLGKIITLTAGHRARIEEKPEVRKAGGVYYTPDYIVDYIVQQTVGKLLEDKTPKQAAGLTILDPACGSGSFLIGAYQCLLDWYLARYLGTSDPQALSKGKNPVLRPTPTGGLALSVLARKRILLDHIYGVDLDHQAVEVTKLNLLLKCLEGETSQTLGFEQRIFRERALPDLGKNIQCGNSLIGADIIGTEAWEKMSETERLRINPFEYARAFPAVFRGKDGGFDAVIGNPPWGSKDILDESESLHIASRFKRSQQNLNTFAVFIDLSMELISRTGAVGLLIPKNFCKTNAYRPYRQSLVEVRTIASVTDFGQFPGVAQECVAICATRSANRKEIEIYRANKEKRIQLPSIRYELLGADQYLVIPLTGIAGGPALAAKIENAGTPLKNYAEIFRGMEFGKNGTLLRCPSCRSHMEKPGKRNAGAKYAACKTCGRSINAQDKSNHHTFIHTAKAPGRRPLLNGHGVDRYEIKPAKMYAETRLPGIDYKQLDQPVPRLLFIRIAEELRGTLDVDGTLCLNALNIVVAKKRGDTHILLGILNSSLMQFFVKERVTAGAKLTIRFSNEIMRSLPIADIGAAKKNAKLLSSLVRSMLSLHKRLANERLPQRREQLQREIDETDRRIDAIVYQLYGLSDEEIQLVENAVGQ